MTTRAPAQTSGHDTWTGRLRERVLRSMPPDQLLPDEQPEYVASWIYVFGVATLAALVFIIGSGLLLTLQGPQWYHVSSVGHFVNSLHLWSVELFFVFMVVHLWGKYWMAAWRGGRTMTWVTGVVCFLASIGAAFTGYLVQTNFDSQWISSQAKDGLNAVGIGAWFNVTNLGQMLLFHVALLPLVLGFIVVWHVILVRRHGVVPPIDATADDAVVDQLDPTGAHVMSGTTQTRGPVPAPARRHRHDDGPREASVVGRQAGVRPAQGARHRAGGRGRPRGRPCGCLQLTRRAEPDDRRVGAAVTQRLRRHGRDRARRHQCERRLWGAIQRHA